MDNNELLPIDTWQTQYRGDNDSEYQIYVACAESLGWAVKTYDEWLKGLTMLVNSDDFTAMRGHVADGCVIRSPSGKLFTLKSTMTGWRIVGPDGVECSGNLPSAFDVECFVVNGLQTH